jgi:hypothetical protein
VALAFVSSIGCTYPGGFAPSTIPVSERYVELGSEEEGSSCGYTFLMLPLTSPNSVPDIIEEMIKNKGGDALVNVSSDSSSTFFLLGFANCVNIRGTVVQFD